MAAAIPMMARAAMIGTAVKSEKTLIMTSAAVMLASLGGVITHSYTADHIKRSSCDMSNDKKLQDAYKWAWSSALISTGVMVATGLIVGVVIFKKAK